MRKVVGALALASICAACGGGSAPEAANAAAPEITVAGSAADTSAGTAGTSPLARAAAAVGIPQYRDITLPAGTTLRLELQSAVGSDSSSVEDAVRASHQGP